MEFVHPHFLWLLLLLPAGVVWQWRRRRRALSHPFTPLLRAAPAGRSRRVRLIGLGCRALILALLIVALARPRWPSEGQRIPVQSLAVVLLLDVSGSMAETDFLLDGKSLSRLDAAKYAFRLFISKSAAQDAQQPSETERSRSFTLPLLHRSPERDGMLVGLLTFAARAEDVCPPTLSHTVVLRMLEAAQPIGTPPDSSTNIGDAIVEGLELARNAKPQQKVLILLSDGEHNVPAEVVSDARRPREAAQLARALGVRIHSIFVGPTTSADPEAAANAAKGEKALQDVAELAGGQAFRAADTAKLRAVCEEIDQLERTRLESAQFYRYLELYPWLGLVCFVFTIGLGFWEGTRWLIVP